GAHDQPVLGRDRLGGLLRALQRRGDDDGDVVVGQRPRHRTGLRPARHRQPETGQPAVEDALRVVHLTVAQHMHDGFDGGAAVVDARLGCGHRGGAVLLVLGGGFGGGQCRGGLGSGGFGGGLGDHGLGHRGLGGGGLRDGLGHGGGIGFRGGDGGRGLGGGLGDLGVGGGVLGYRLGRGGLGGG